MTVIDGTSNTVVATVTDVSNPDSIAVNPATNKVYVANLGPTMAGTSAYVTIIDGSTYADTTINVGSTATTTSLTAIAVNPATNQVYAVGEDIGHFGFVFQIDATTPIPTVPNYQAVGAGPYAIVVNPVTNKVYVSNT